MKTLRDQSDSAADEQASLWAARLEGGTLSAHDRDALDAWIAADKSHRALLSRYCQFSADLEEQLLALVATGAVALPPEPAPVLRRFAPWNWIGGSALAAAAVVLLVFWLGRPHIENIATAAAQRQTLTLDDGTRVELSARTTLTAEIGRKERHVRLTGGEAFFTVSKDPSRPFIIDTPTGAVRVTGTVFDVRTDAGADELEVTVVEGSVQVRPGEAQSTAEPRALKANDQLRANASGITTHTLSAAELDNALAWRKGQIVFDGVPLREALAQFARYHGRVIKLSPAADAKDFHLSGPFSLDDLNGFLPRLQQIFPVKPTIEPNGDFRVSLNTEP